jgi:predicted methyltransferase
MRTFNALAVSLALIAVPFAAAPAFAAPTTIAAAVAASDRNSDNVKLDEGRKPAQVLAFFGLKPGMNVLDLVGANAYWAEITSPVVGSKGHVTVWEPTQFYNDKNKASFEAFAAKHPNVSIRVSSMEAPDLPKNYADLVIFNENYHDLYVDFSKRGIPQIEPRQWLKALYASVKPGGVVGLIDHAANAGDTRATANALHRIDPNTAKADFQSAGFVFVKSSDVLRNPADDHTLKVFDPKVRGKTDRFVFLFKKPR